MEEEAEAVEGEHKTVKKEDEGAVGLDPCDDDQVRPVRLVRSDKVPRSILKEPTGFKVHNGLFRRDWLQTWNPKMALAAQEMVKDSASSGLLGTVRRKLHGSEEPTKASRKEAAGSVKVNGSSAPGPLDPLRQVRFSMAALTLEYPVHDDQAHLAEEIREQIESEHREWLEKRKMEAWSRTELWSIYLKSCKMWEESPLQGLWLAMQGAEPGPLTTLDLSDVAISPDAARPLADLLSIDFGLKKLVLDGTDLVDGALRILVSALQLHPTLTTLSLAKNKRLTASGFKWLALYAARARSLSYLDLGGTVIDKGAAEHIAQALESPARERSAGIQSLRLENCTIKANALETLAYGVRRSRTLRNLSLKRNRLGSASTLALAVMLRDALPEGVADVGVGGGGDETKGAGSSVGSTLLTLDLRCNNLGSGMSYLASVLRRNTTLKNLNLAENKIDPHGLALLAESLRHNSTLETLDLCRNACCGPSLEGLVALKQTLAGPQPSSSLRRLYLGSTALESQGAILLAEILPEAKHLVHFDLKDNRDISLAGFMALAAAVQLNRSIRCLDLDIPPNDRDFAKSSREILQACIRNTELAQEKRLKGSRGEPNEAAEHGAAADTERAHQGANGGHGAYAAQGLSDGGEAPVLASRPLPPDLETGDEPRAANPIWAESRSRQLEEEGEVLKGHVD